MAIGAANAADLPSFEPYPVPIVLPPRPYSWTGFYGGVNGGFGVDHFAFPFFLAEPSDTVTGTSGITSNGPVAGGQVGFNYQFFNVPLISTAFVGVEGSLDWADLRGSVTVPTSLGAFTASTHFDDFATLRVRFGYPIDRFLIYIAGGLTFGTMTNSFELGAPSNLANALTFTHSGFIPHVDTIGIGVEYAIDHHWSVRAEYLYDFVFSGMEFFTPTPNSTVQFNSRAAYHIGTLGFNYKFDLFAPPVPIVAKY